MSSYIFLGPELGKKQDAVDSVRKKYSGTSTEETVFYAGETPASTIADTLQNSCLFADTRIVIVKNAELIKKKDEVELLVSCIKNMEENTALILLSDEIKLAANLDNTVPPNNRQIFYEMFEREKNEWLRQFFKRTGCNIDKDAITAVLELVENNTAALKNECTRLINFIQAENGKDHTITAEDIEKWFSHNREESAFTLFSRIANGDKSRALESMSVMLAAKQSGQSILAGLAWCFRKLGDYIILMERGDAGNFAELRKIGLSSPKAKDDYSAAARRYTTLGAHACLAITAEYDLLLRSPVSVMENILMDRYILDLFNQSTKPAI
ncbi:MAG: DNA polymerase III subunit delta [Treponema sp.]|jgi:DNA polymerase-3 subunit delta|nr:DNA polymerase III subunit delta [Treponema sp.]